MKSLSSRTRSGASGSGARRRYTAPALEKGLDMLELLAGEEQGLPASQIALRLGRSMGELFRMIVALEGRGYIHRRDDGTLTLTLRLFELAHRHPPMSRLMSEALPLMRELAEETGQSCHLSVYNDGRILVVAQAESPRQRGFTVRLGAGFGLAETASGRVLAAFQEPAERARRIARAGELDSIPDEQRLRGRLSDILARGHEVARSDTTVGIVDLSYPIRDHRSAAVAALTIPYIQTVGNPLDEEATLERLGHTADRLSRRVGFT
jgi:DNA-binding IclR family transcriptional regulator